ncbi:MAG: SsrA-binding protein SmpB [Clostridiales bacterium]|nr:SsrA-binding protein SmpB [Clostridiales bacterium]MBO5334814.1 SsrA-binding protein SmpB [Clostridia bacterium]MBQ8352541.1 SsrA-binding protein SmpB [Clostridia bacterium]
MKIIAVNKSASFEYFIEEKYEAGIVLEGNEIKSLRAGNVNMNDCFCFVRGNVVSIKNMHIAFYEKSDGFHSRDTRRDRRLLLHKSEIAKIAGKINRQGYTLVPLKLYFKDSLVKVEVALCRGKHTYDKKATIAARDQKRATEREIKAAGI